MLAMRQILLGPMGAPTPPLPYDYAVEYVEKDYNTSYATSSLFDLSSYSSSLPQNLYDAEIDVEVDVASSGTGANIRHFCLFVNAIIGLNLLYAASSGKETLMFGFGQAVNFRDSQGLDDFHTYGAQISNHVGVGLLDGVSMGSFNLTNTTPFSQVMVMNGVQQGSMKSRMKSMKVAGVLDCIPVISNGVICLYNRLDGSLLEQKHTDGVSAGPRI